jgi:very-short-patch-repair endonuclease
VGCLSVERTLIDLAREHGLVSGVVAMDYALGQKLTSVATVSAELDACARWPGVRNAREALALADPLSESPLESRSRLKFREVGIRPPKTQIRIGDAAARFIGRVDFYWDEYGVVGEADGAVKYDGTDPAPLHGEKLRHEALEDAGLTVVRWGNSDLNDFSQVATRLRRAFGRPIERRWTVLPRL